jgi:glycosyltransferase involved in cell wall biosynthesis
VDAVPLQKSSLNHWLCTPNKLWESLTAGVPVVVSDFPAMHSIVLEDPDGSLGEICEPADPASIGAAICRILALDPEHRAALRQRCLHAAQTRWNWETESVGLLDLYAELAAEHGRAADATPA